MSASAPLYELTAALAPLRRALAEAEPDPETGEVGDADLLAALDAAEQPYTERLLDAYRYAMTLEAEAAPIEAQADAFEREAERIRSHSERLLRDAERVRATILRSMEATRTARVQAPGLVLAVKPGADRVEVDDLAAVPADLRRAPPPPPPPAQWPVDKHEAAKRLKCGDHVPGLRLVRGPSTLTVK